jgi:hypothetical protein
VLESQAALLPCRIVCSALWLARAGDLAGVGLRASMERLASSLSGCYAGKGRASTLTRNGVVGAGRVAIDVNPGAEP